MSKEEALKQLETLNYDWQTNGLDCKLNQTDINAINIIIEALDITNKKLEQIKNHVQTQQSIIKRQPSADRSIDDYILARLDTILSIIGGNDEK